MKILKTDWIGHFEQQIRKAVYAVDICNDNEHVATGGIDGVVKIWSLSSMKECCADSEKSQSSKALATMNRHSGAVTVVKFSPDGKYLATGSDDRIILIWEKEGKSQAAQYMSSSLKTTENGTNEPSTNAFAADHNEEHWVVRRRLAAHDNDIQDICWSPDSTLLVSVGLDRSIIVWNGVTFEKIKKFDVHHSLVKGVIFDPANKYFATASDDRTVKIFRYHRINGELHFSIEANITEPFKGSPITTYFRRLSWSPDGQHIAAPNATNGPVSTVAIINRGSWECNVSLIGHTSPSEVARFNPRLFKKTSPDREIEIEVDEYTENEIIDMEDEADELKDENEENDEKDEDEEEQEDDDDIVEITQLNNGTEVSKTRNKPQTKRMHRVVNKVKKIQKIPGEETINSILCSAGQDKTLTLWSTMSERPIFTAYDFVSKSVTDACWNKYGDVLIVTSLDGSIIPIFFFNNELGIPVPLENNVEYLHRYGVGKEVNAFPESIDQLVFEESSLVEREKNKKKYLDVQPKDPVATSLLSKQTPHSDVNFGTQKPDENVKVNILIPKRKKDVLKNATVQSNGKKRVAPTLVSTSASSFVENDVTTSGMKSSSVFATAAASKSISKKQKKKRSKFQLAEKLSKHSYPVPRLGVHTLIMGIKEKPLQNSEGGQEIRHTDHITGVTDYASKSKPSKLTLNARSTLSKVLSADVETRYTEFPNTLPDADCILAGAGKDVDDMYVLEIRNGVERSIQFDKDALYENPTKITGYYHGQKVLCEFIPEVVSCAKGSIENKLWAITTTEGSLFLFSLSGRFVVPKISLGYKIAKLKFVSNHLLLLTETGLVYVFDVDQMKLILSKISIAPLLLDYSSVNQANPNRARIQKKLCDFEYNEGVLKVDVILRYNDSKPGRPSDIAVNSFHWNSDMFSWMSHVPDE